VTEGDASLAATAITNTQQITNDLMSNVEDTD
jgi:hypothetical protein